VFTGVFQMFEIDLEWPVASGYEVRPVGERDFAIYPREGATVALRRPLESNPSLYAEFARLDGSEQSCLQFAQKYGLLGVDHYRDDLIVDLYKIHSLRYWRWAVAYIGRVIDFCQLGVSNPAEALRQFGKQEFRLQGELELFLSTKSSKSPPSIDMRCKQLLGAIELQAIRSIISGRRAMQCIECSTWFEIGGGARRSLAKFCSIRCKDSYHNRLKASTRVKQSKGK